MHASKVSVVVPCYNEARTIRLMLDGIISQSFPLDQMEVIIADGMSTDRTRKEIAEFQQDHPELHVRVVDNPARIIPAAVNRAIEAAEGEFIIRLDAHSRPESTYVERCVAALEAGKAANVGGVWQIAPGAQTWIAESISAAAAHPLGVGDAHYRHAKKAQFVDTVPFGAFRKSLIEQVGPFDETLLTNEDYEFNVRVRKSGGRIWLDPEIRTTYYARSTFTGLARQYLRYGFWKGRMLLRYPDTLRVRQFIPPLFVAGLIVGGLMSIFWEWPRLFYMTVIGLYVLLLLWTGLVAAIRSRKPGLAAGMPVAISIMHFCWGSALLWSVLKRK